MRGCFHGKRLGRNHVETGQPATGLAGVAED
jgi:hypothetical protein